jgi:hypothetical protein
MTTKDDLPAYPPDQQFMLQGDAFMDGQRVRLGYLFTLPDGVTYGPTVTDSQLGQIVDVPLYTPVDADGQPVDPPATRK